MKPDRFSRDDESRTDSSEQLFPVLASETMRNSSRRASHQQPQSQPQSKSGEEKLSIFWRVFGGTVLSICALVVITAYQGLSGGIRELRTDLSHANEARAELVKKDEFSTARAKIWDKLGEMQKDVTTVGSPIDPMKVRLDKLEAGSQSMDAERREIHELHATLKERLSQIEQQLTQAKAAQKDLQSLQQTVQGVQDKLAFREQQLKQSEDERKELAKEIQLLRERIAKVEATKDSRPSPAKTTGKPKTDDDEH
jgi:chromosome segregation ATPase